MDGSSSGTARIVVVDDEANVRVGLKLRLDTEPDLEVIGTAATGAEAIGLVRRLRPDLVLMDVRLPAMDGFETTAALRRTCPTVAVVMLSLYDEVTTRQRAREVGAAAFVSKHDGDHALLRTIRHQLADPAPLSIPLSPPRSSKELP